MILGVGLRRIVGCPACGDSPHAEDCPRRTIDSLQKLIRHRSADCPECNGRVSRGLLINDDDHYECRRCHVQITTSAGSFPAGSRQVSLLNYHGELIHGHVLPTKGTGQFALLRELELAQKTFKQWVNDRQN